jgi:ParB family chromosome partitioning protein
MNRRGTVDSGTGEEPLFPRSRGGNHIHSAAAVYVRGRRTVGQAMGETDTADVTPGTIVTDADDPSPNRAVVVNTPRATASEWRTPGGTVASDNPDYDADEAVVVVAYLDDLHETDYWAFSGPWPLPLKPLTQSSAEHYSFPEGRLETHTRREPATLPTCDLLPSPYHTETFGLDDQESRALVEKIRENGFFAPVAAHRRDDGRFVLLNGHRRVWAASVLGLDQIPVRPRYAQSPRQVAEIWAKNHLPDYDRQQRAEAYQRLRKRLGDDVAREVIDRHANVSVVVDTAQQVAADGGSRPR